MKKVPYLVLAFVLIFALSINAMAANVSVDEEPGAVSTGNTVTVTVTLDEGLSIDAGSTAVQGMLNYDKETLTYVSGIAGEGYEYLTFVNNTRDSRINFYYLSMSNPQVPVAVPAGTVAVFTFTANETVDVADLKFTMSLVCADANGNSTSDSITEFTSIIVCLNHDLNQGNTCTDCGAKFAAIVTQPKSVTVAEGQYATVTVGAEGDGLTYEWYYSSNGGKSFTKTTAFTGNTYKVAMTAARSGRQLYCVVSDRYGNSVKTDVVTISMETKLAIVTQPKSVTVAEGQYATVTVGAEGDGLTYEWYYSSNGGKSFTKTTAFTGNTYKVAMTAARSGRQLYCVVSDRYGNSVKTDVVTISMETKLAIVTQPKSVTVASGEYATVTVKAEGDGLTYEWYYSSNGGKSFTKTDAFTGNTYKVPMTAARSGRQLYCVVSDQYGNSVKTDVVTISMETKLAIVTQPKSVTVASGEYATVTVKAEGDGLTYEWYYSSNGGKSFTKTDAFTGNTYKVPMTAARSGRQIYCVVSDQYGNSIKTDVVTISMEAKLAIVTQPKGGTFAENSVARTTVTATGEGLSYEWWVLNAGGQWVKSSITSSTYSYTMTAAKSGRKVYCVVTDKDGNTVTTDIVTFNMASDVQITSQPKDVTVEEGSIAKTTVKASGEALSYEWWIMDAGSGKWVKSSVTSSTYACSMTAAKSGRQIYCKITDADGNIVTTEIATLSTTP